MKKLYVFYITLSIILSPLFSFPDKDTILEKPQNEFHSRITITGSASIIITEGNDKLILTKIYKRFDY